MPVLSAGIFAHASLIKPGLASCLTPKSGTHQLWITSFEVIKKRIRVSAGITKAYQPQVSNFLA